MTEEPLLWWLAHNTFFAAVLAGIVFLACRLGRLRPAVRHALWLVVLIKLATPPLLTWPWSTPALWPSEPAVSAEPSPAAEAAPLARADLPLGDWQAKWRKLHGEPESKLVPSDSGPDKEEFLVTYGRRPSETAEDWAASPSQSRAFTWQIPRVWTWSLAVLWAAAALGMIVLQLVRVIRFQKLLGKSAAAPDELTNQVSALAAQLGVTAPRTRLVPGIASPMVWGLGRPTLLWPASLVDRLSPTCQRAVLVHELAHLRRRDHWIGWLQLLAGCAWWWHPLYRYVSRQVRANAELACDAWVVNLLPAARRAYAEALIEVSQLLARKTAPMPVLGMAAGRVDLERRLVMIMRDSMPCRLSLRSLLILGAIALIALPGWSLSQQSREKPGSEKKGEKDSEIQKDEEIQGIYEIEAQLDELKMAPLEFLERYELAAVEDGQPATGKEADRLEKLEKQLEALLKEVKSLRASKGVWKERSKVKTEDIHQYKTWNADPNVKFENVHLWDKGWNVPPNQAGDQPIILSRATYKMPRAKAEALAAFLRGQLNEQTLETRVEEDAIVITTLPEIQKTIGQFIGLVQGRTFTFESSNQDKPAVK